MSTAPATLDKHGALCEADPRGRVDGVFCGADYLALAFRDAIRHDKGLRVPHELQVIGFNDIPQAAWSSRLLTTFRRNTEATAEETVAQSRHRMQNADAPARVSPVELVSTSPTSRWPLTDAPVYCPFEE